MTSQRTALPSAPTWGRSLALAAVLLCGCASRPAAPTSLYERLGGTPVVSVVIGHMVDRASTDPRTMRSFDGVKLPTLKESLVQHICFISGGGCHYEGDSMAVAHHDSHIVASEFDAMTSILREELDRAGVDYGAKNALLRLLAPMKREIVAAR